jgi:hypothetical protein
MKYRSKKHHFVPIILQKQFSSEINGSIIWYSERGVDGEFKAPVSKEMKKAFVIDNYYTVLQKEESSDIVEKKFYGGIDNYLGEVLPKILLGFKNGSIPTFAGEPLENVRDVNMEMAKRTPEFTKKYDDIEIGREIVESTLLKLPHNEIGEDRRQLIADLNNPNRLREIGRNTRVRATIRRSELVDGALKDFSVRWAVINEKHSFILSSLMVYRIGNGGPNGLSNPNMEMWMPVSPKIALVLVRDPQNKIPLVVREGGSHIRQINEYAATNSQQIASHSQKLIESLTGKRAVFD